MRAAIAAAVVPAVAVAAFGNQWFSEHIRFEAKTALARRLVNTVGGPFQWRFSPRGGDRATTLWAAQIFGIIAIVGLTFLVAWLAARAAASSGLLIAIWGGTVVASMVAYALFIAASYDAIYDGREIEPGLNWFWYSVFHSSDATLWGAGVGLVAAGAAVLFSGGAARPAAVEPVTHGAGPAPAPPGAPWEGSRPPVDVPPAPWTAVPPRPDTNP
jgi:hypothetical protein